ncbi:MAG: acylphosphatase [Deltaproteobacteria bacterium]|nr:acylphosphatase [Deltaproteobacteria bacterium]MBW2444923.1 acylphosphatase [Deltaproteobacteria bacterium]
MSTRVRRHIVVRGRVQGVAFRWSTRDAAQRIGVDGWVCNQPDGSVEAVFEGEPAAVAEAEAFCAQGPPAAHVTAVESRDEPAEGLVGFEIR